MAFYKVTKKQEGGGVTLKKYAYFDGSFCLSIGHNYETDALMLNSNYKTELKFYDPAYINDRYIMSGKAGSYYSSLRVQSNNFQCSSGNTNMMNVGSYSVGEHIFIENDDNGKCQLDGVATTGSYSLAAGAENSPTRIRMLGGNTTDEHSSSGTGYWVGYVEYLKVTNKTTGNVIHEIVPCEFEGLAYLYNKVTKLLYYSQGLTVMDAIPTT